MKIYNEDTGTLRDATQEEIEAISAWIGDSTYNIFGHEVIPGRDGLYTHIFTFADGKARITSAIPECRIVNLMNNQG